MAHKEGTAMTTQEYTRLRLAATQRAHLLRQQAVFDFWAAVLRRFTKLASTSNV
jgi:hypothetical protein